MSLDYDYDMVLLPPRAPSDNDPSPCHRRRGRRPGHHGHRSRHARHAWQMWESPRPCSRTGGDSSSSRVLLLGYRDRIPREGLIWHGPSHGQSTDGTGCIGEATLRGTVTLHGVHIGDRRACGSAVAIPLFAQQRHHGLLPLDAFHHKLLRGASRASSTRHP
jgi:hypothetical protein